MLSKSRGQILRVAATFHVLHYINQPLVIPDTISESAIKAAENFVDMCIQLQHTLLVEGMLKKLFLPLLWVCSFPLSA